MELSEIDSLLNKQSGLKGLTGDNDLREILKRHDNNDLQAQLAIQMYVYRIKKYIGAYAVALGEVDAIIFTAGVGENSAFIREGICSELAILGVKVDKNLNSAELAEIREIHQNDSLIKLLVVPTNEELEIANQTEKLLSST